MALIICPDCGKSISDKAPACPQCGCPVQQPFLPPQVEQLKPPIHTKPQGHLQTINKFQKVWLIIGMIMFLFVGLFPPWIKIEVRQEKFYREVVSLNPPEIIEHSKASSSQFESSIFGSPYASSDVSYHLDTPRLLMEWVGIAVVTILFVFLAKKQQWTSEDDAKFKKYKRRWFLVMGLIILVAIMLILLSNIH